MSLVRDREIFYLVLTKQDNTFDTEFIKQINECIDEVEATTGAAVLIVIGTGDKIFSTGFNLPRWQKEGVIYQWQTIMQMHKVFDRILTMSIPTLCVQNGLTIAGGLLMSLMCDFRIMKDDPKNFVCLSEINIGISLSPGLGAIVKYQLDPQTARLLAFGGRHNAQ
jgi:Delta3-Delta2-enoyl-CoA isomerase